mgnify:CR=1 FL=1
MVREVREETGLDVSVGPIVEVLDRIHMDGSARVEYHYVLIDYLCFVVGGQLHPQSDAADARWVLPANLATFALQPVTLAVVQKALALAEARA